MIFNKCIFLHKNLPELVPWSTGTDAQIKAMIEAADDNLIDLKDCWNIGDTRSITLTSSEVVNLVLMDFTCNGFDIGNGRKPNAIVGTKDCLQTADVFYWYSSAHDGWKESYVRPDINGYLFKDKLPTDTLQFFKQFTWQSYDAYNSRLNTTTDYFALPPAKCVGNDTGLEKNLYNIWQYYSNRYNRNKINARYWYTSTPGSSTNYIVSWNNLNSAFQGIQGNASNGISPFGCI